MNSVDTSAVLTYTGGKYNGFKFRPYELEQTNTKEEETILLAKLLADPSLLASNNSLKKADQLVHRLDKRRESNKEALKPANSVNIWSDVPKAKMVNKAEGDIGKERRVGGWRECRTSSGPRSVRREAGARLVSAVIRVVGWCFDSGEQRCDMKSPLKKHTIA